MKTVYKFDPELDDENYVYIDFELNKHWHNTQVTAAPCLTYGFDKTIRFYVYEGKYYVETSDETDYEEVWLCSKEEFSTYLSVVDSKFLQWLNDNQ